jgi:hypothetical protein
VGRLERVLLIRVTLPSLDKYNVFQLANRRSINYKVPLAVWIFGRKGKLKYLRSGKESDYTNIAIISFSKMLKEFCFVYRKVISKESTVKCFSLPWGSAQKWAEPEWWL